MEDEWQMNNGGKKNNPFCTSKSSVEVFNIFYQRLPSRGVILFRFAQEQPTLKIAALDTLLKRMPDKILNHFIVMSESGIRIRPLAR